MLRKRTTLNLGHALVGIGTEIGEIVECLAPYISGASQLTQGLRDGTRNEFGDLCYYTVLAAKVAKRKVPASTKKVKLKHGTTTEALLRLNTLGKDLLSQYKRVYYGLPLNEEKIGPLLDQLIELVWELSYTLFGEPPAGLLAENTAKLQKRFSTGQFTQQAIIDKEASEAPAAAPVAADPAPEAVQPIAQAEPVQETASAS